jgi:hypothetical protein
MTASPSMQVRGKSKGADPRPSRVLLITLSFSAQHDNTVAGGRMSRPDPMSPQACRRSDRDK